MRGVQDIADDDNEDDDHFDPNSDGVMLNGRFHIA